MRRCRLLPMVVLVCGLHLVCPSAGQTLYHLTDMGHFPYQGFPVTQPYAMNELGQVAGRATADGYISLAFRWDRREGLVALGDLPGGSASSVAYAINSVGHVAGISGSGDGGEAFFWSPETGMIGLGDLPGGFFRSTGTGINDLDQVCGYSNIAGTDEAFIWDAQNGMRGIGSLPGGEFRSEARAINNRGQVTGYSGSAAGGEAFIYDPATGMHSLGPFPGGGRASTGYDINELGQIAGNAGGRGYLWDPEEGFTLTGILSTRRRSGHAWGLNDLGQVVGWVTPDNRRGPIWGTIWDRQHGLRRLDDLLDAASRALNLTIQHATAINNHGQIVGIASGAHGVLLDPFVLADMNCDEVVDASDIHPFLMALNDPDLYAQKYPDCHADWAGDVNQDGVFDEADLAPFIRRFLRAASD